MVAWLITVVGKLGNDLKKKMQFWLSSGDTLSIPDSVMGLTFLAAGTSVPEAVSSVIVTNQGRLMFLFSKLVFCFNSLLFC